MYYLYHNKYENTLEKLAIWDLNENGLSSNMLKMATGCHSNNNAHFEEKTLIIQIIHNNASSDQREGVPPNMTFTKWHGIEHR